MPKLSRRTRRGGGEGGGGWGAGGPPASCPRQCCGRAGSGRSAGGGRGCGGPEARGACRDGEWARWEWARWEWARGVGRCNSRPFGNGHDRRGSQHYSRHRAGRGQVGAEAEACLRDGSANVGGGEGCGGGGLHERPLHHLQVRPDPGGHHAHQVHGRVRGHPSRRQVQRVQGRVRGGRQAPAVPGPRDLQHRGGCAPARIDAGGQRLHRDARGVFSMAKDIAAGGALHGGAAPRRRARAGRCAGPLPRVRKEGRREDRGHARPGQAVAVHIRRARRGRAHQQPPEASATSSCRTRY